MERNPLRSRRPKINNPENNGVFDIKMREIASRAQRGKILYPLLRKFGVSEQKAKRIVRNPIVRFLGWIKSFLFFLSTFSVFLLPMLLFFAVIAALFGGQSASNPNASVFSGGGSIGGISANGDMVYLSVLDDGFAIPVGIPQTGRITQVEGSNWLLSNGKLAYSKGHMGVDIGQKNEIYATIDGTLSYKDTGNNGYGCYAVISVVSPSDPSKVTQVMYGHMDRVEVCNRAQLNTSHSVVAGQLIGYTGTTGLSTGIHLHYEIRKNNKMYTVWPSYFLGYTEPGVAPQFSLLNSNISAGLPFTSNVSGIAWAMSVYKDERSEQWKKFYDYLRKSPTVRMMGVEPLRIMAILHREAPGVLGLIQYDSMGNIVYNEAIRNYGSGNQDGPFQIINRHENCPYISSFETELRCFIEFFGHKRPLELDAQTGKWIRGENALKSSEPITKFAEVAFAYNGLGYCNPKVKDGSPAEISRCVKQWFRSPYVIANLGVGFEKMSIMKGGGKTGVDTRPGALTMLFAFTRLAQTEWGVLTGVSTVTPLLQSTTPETANNPWQSDTLTTTVGDTSAPENTSGYLEDSW